MPLRAEKATIGKLRVADPIRALLARGAGGHTKWICITAKVECEDCGHQCPKRIGSPCYKLLIRIESLTCVVERPPFLSLRKWFGQ